MASIFDFWATLLNKKSTFREIDSLNEFPYDNSHLSYIKLGKGFPNFSIKVNQNRKDKSGGELVKIKESNNYVINPFNSFTPVGKWNIKNNSFITQNNFIPEEGISSKNERDVYYLISGHKNDFQKICLVHGVFLKLYLQKI